MSNFNSTLKWDLETRFGPLLGGADLWRCLGFRTAAAFARALRLGVIEVRVFELPSRRGKFALTRDVAAWLERAASAERRPAHVNESSATDLSASRSDGNIAARRLPGSKGAETASNRKSNRRRA